MTSLVGLAVGCFIAACGRGGPWERLPQVEREVDVERVGPDVLPCDVSRGGWTADLVRSGTFGQVTAIADDVGALHISFIGTGEDGSRGLWYVNNVNQAFIGELVTSQARPYDTDISLSASGEVQLAWFGRGPESSAMGVYTGRRTSSGWDARLINPEGRLWNQVRYSYVSLDTTQDGRSHLMFRIVANQLGFAHGVPGAWDFGFEEVFTATLPVAASADRQGRIDTAYHRTTYRRSDEGRVVEVQGDLRLHHAERGVGDTLIERSRVSVTTDRPPAFLDVWCGAAVSVSRGPYDALHAVYGFTAGAVSGEQRCTLRHAVRRGGEWSYETVVSSPGTSWVATDVDSDGAIHVAYVTPDGAIEYATDRSGTFRVERVPGARGARPDIALGADATVHIVYYDEQAEAVRASHRAADERCR